MKKFLISIIAIFMAFILVPTVHAEGKVPVYMITKDGCPACTSAYEYFAKLEKEHPDEFELIPIEVFDAEWGFNSENHEKAFKAIYELIKEDTSEAATPTIVIGSYHTIGLPSDTNEVYDAIKDYTKNKEKDSVAEALEKLKIDVESIRKTDTENKTSKSNDTLIIIGIVVVLVGGFVALLVTSGKKEA